MAPLPAATPTLPVPQPTVQRRQMPWRAAAAAVLLPVASAQSSCAWTDPASGATFDLAPIQAEQHYQFRGLVGSKDGMHATTITAYEDYTYFLNLCRPATAINFEKCEGKPVSNAAVYQVREPLRETARPVLEL